MKKKAEFLGNNNNNNNKKVIIIKKKREKVYNLNVAPPVSKRGD